MNPNNVISPRKKLANLQVILEREHFSLATFTYEGFQRVGIRWNGEENALGFPRSRGRATWFIIPKEVAIAYAEKQGDTELLLKIRNTSPEKFI